MRRAAFGLIALAGCASMGAAEFGKDFSVDLTRYDGRWYDIARTPNSFQDNTVVQDGKTFGPCFGSTADYTIIDAETISVTNTCTREAPDGTTLTETAEGSARVKDSATNRRLSVAFGGGFAQAIQRVVAGSAGNYWIYCLSPVTGTGDYDWAVVSGPDKDNLFVLARVPQPDAALEAAWRSCAAAEGLPVDRAISRLAPAG